jgi:hypothetical protein
VRSRQALVGRDFARARPRRSAWRRVWPAAFAGLLLAALALAALRNDLIRVRYGLAEAMAEEKRLLERQRELTAELRRLRHPARLRERAEALGLVAPERALDLRPRPPAALAEMRP